MLWLVFGALTLFLFLGGLRAFERASVSTIKSLVAWIAAHQATHQAAHQAPKPTITRSTP